MNKTRSAGMIKPSRCLALLVFSMIFMSCIKTVPKTVLISSGKIALEGNATEFLRLVDGNYEMSADVRNLSASITIKLELTKDFKSYWDAEADRVEKQYGWLKSDRIDKRLGVSLLELYPVDKNGGGINSTRDRLFEQFFDRDVFMLDPMFFDVETTNRLHSDADSSYAAYNSSNAKFKNLLLGNVGDTAQFSFLMRMVNKKSFGAVMDCSGLILRHVNVHSELYNETRKDGADVLAVR
jgi:hypothetical protein